MSRDRVQQVFSPNVSPAITVNRGETIVVETQDCYQGLLAEVADTHRDADGSDGSDQSDRSSQSAGIPVTGPIYVEEAHIGDVLSIHVKQIKTAGTGVFAVRPETGVPGQDIQKPEVRVLEVAENHVQLDEKLKLPLHPVIGSMGVAAKHGEIDSAYPGRHGGNMDTMEITTGSRVYLPVQVNGALLSLGDVKACVGDGQIAGSGVEVEAEVTLRVDTLPGGRFSWPRVESKGEWITITSASTVDQAARLAITEMVKWITQDKGLDFNTAYALVSLGGSLRVSQWGNPLTTARMVFPKRLINKLRSVPIASGRLNYRALPPAANGGTGGETVAAEAEQPASRSSRRSGSGRSQRASGRSRQSGSRRGTRQKSNGASSSASAENTRAENIQTEAMEQQDPVSRQDAAVEKTDEKANQQDAAVEKTDEKTSRQDVAAEHNQTEAMEQQDEAGRQDAATMDADEQSSQAAVKGNGHGDKPRRSGRTGRTRRTGRRKDPAAKKDAAPGQAEASAVAADAVSESGGEPEAKVRRASSGADREETREPAVANRRKKPKAEAEPEASKKPSAEAQPATGEEPKAVTEQPERPAAGKGPGNEELKTGSGAGQGDTGQKAKAAGKGDTGRKPTFGRRQRTVRRA